MTSPLTLTRRQALLTGSCAAAATFAPLTAFAALPTDKRFVLVILRGGMDGLAAVPAVGEPAYAPARGALAEFDALTLDGTFGLHPALAGLHELYKAGEAAIVHAVAPPYRERSHFDGQDVLESGANAVYGAKDGWLNRALGALGARDPARSLAVAPQTPLVLRGDAPATSWAPTRLPTAEADTYDRLADLYSNDPVLSDALMRARAADDVARGMDMDAPPRRGGRFAGAAEAATRFLKEPNGARVAVLEAGGWDTHVRQGAGEGRLARGLADLDQGLRTMRDGLGRDWAQTLVLVVTEFGRTVRTNGTGGSDHGVGGAAFALGGAVKGGRVLADWPGLRDRDLYEGRDLKATTDVRALFKAALTGHLGLGEGAVEDRVFPGSRTVTPLEGLFV